MKHVILVIVCLAGSQMLAPTVSLADVLKCKIDSYREDIFITTAPHTDQNDGQYARIGISPGIGDRAIVFADRMGAVAFVELNTDGTPVGLMTVQKDFARDQITSSNRSLRRGFRPKPKCGRVYAMRWTKDLFALALTRGTYGHGGASCTAHANDVYRLCTLDSECRTLGG